MEGLVMIYATISRHALKGQKLLAQGDALGEELLPVQGVWGLLAKFSK